MNLSRIDGAITGLERTTHVTGGSNRTSTSHVCLFTLQGERVMLRSDTPAMIADGDFLTLVGERQPGQFSAVACRNRTTGWQTQFQKQGCAKAFLIVITILTLIPTLFMPLFFFLPLLFGFLLSKVMKFDTQMRKAHEMLDP